MGIKEKRINSVLASNKQSQKKKLKPHKDAKLIKSNIKNRWSRQIDRIPTNWPSKFGANSIRVVALGSGQGRQFNQIFAQLAKSIRKIRHDINHSLILDDMWNKSFASSWSNIHKHLNKLHPRSFPFAIITKVLPTDMIGYLHQELLFLWNNDSWYIFKMLGKARANVKPIILVVEKNF